MSPELGNAEEHTGLISMIKPKYSTGLHEHNADEFMYVVTGYGEAITTEDDNEKVEPVHPDSLTLFQKREMHNVKNTGDESSKLFRVFHPALKPNGKLSESIEVQKK